ncbi:Transmembrane protein 241 [Frankliniella fusca]|uniref:Transmembrane protein 241 n=1 Tax=Frankliniella fusca TaxID=407009 RepID=A0AAE1HJX4_9NEOP|nr:Transmembrane protein 241 [Frankliniella fusca]
MTFIVLVIKWATNSMSTMKFYIKSDLKQLVLLIILHTCTIHINKFILSVLGFTYPTVFQGWQTLVAVILMRILLIEELKPISWTSFYSNLPLFLCFVANIVAGSKALSSLPVPVVVALSNVVPVLINTLGDHQLGKNYINFIASLLAVLSSICIFLVDSVLMEKGIPAMWMILHILFLGAQCLADIRTSSAFSSFDRLFYCNLFSVVVLAPSSLYLEEAFLALHFQKRSQLSFLLGCVMSGILGTVMSLITSSPTPNSLNIAAIAKAVSCLVSPYILPCKWFQIVQ